MTFFNRAARWVESWTLGGWLNDLLMLLTNDVILPIIKQIGQEAFDALIDEVVRQSGKQLSGAEKLNNVVKHFKEMYVEVSITDRALNLIIELIVNMLKKEKII